MKVALFHWQIEVNPTSTILTIKQAFPEDSGLITCRIKNISGTTECSAELYVQGKCSSAHPSAAWETMCKGKRARTRDHAWWWR